MSVKQKIANVRNKAKTHLSKQTHRSLKMTKQRDYKRPMNIPGLWKFTIHVNKIFWKNRKTFVPLVGLVIFMTLILIGMGSQETYSAMVSTLDNTSGDFFDSAFGKVESAGLLFLAAASGGISQTLDSVQQIYLFLTALFTWLITVWLLRNIISGNKVKLRDGVYSAGSPIIATVLLAIIGIVQLFPFVIALIGFGAAMSTGLLDGGVETMLFWVVAGLLTTLSIYWLSSTFFAMIIVTIPGMYPFRALGIARDLVMGRRLRIIIRLLWLAFVVSCTWAIVFIPVILIDIWIKSVWAWIEWFPTIPILILLFSSATTVWVSGYIYILYRKIVDNDSK